MKAGSHPTRRGMLLAALAAVGCGGTREFPSPEPPLTVKPVFCEGHKGHVYGVAASPDGRTLATGGEDGNLRLWTASTGKQRWSVMTQPREDGAVPCVYDVAYSPDGHEILVGSRGGVLLIDAATGTRINRLSPDTGGRLAVGYSPNGEMIASGGEEVAVQDRRTGRVLFRYSVPPHGRCESVAFSPDGRHLAVGRSGGGDDNQVVGPLVQVFSVPDGRRVFDALTNDRTGCPRVAFSPDGGLLALSRNGECVVEFHDWRKGRPVREVDVGGRVVHALLFDPRRGHLVVAGDDPAFVYLDPETGKVSRRMAGHRHSISAFSFAARADVLSAASRDGRASAWRLGE